MCNRGSYGHYPRLQFIYGRSQPSTISKLCRFTTTDRQSSSAPHFLFAKPQVRRLRHWQKRRRGRPSRNHRSKPAWFWGDGAGRLATGPDNGAGGTREARCRVAGLPRELKRPTRGSGEDGRAGGVWPPALRAGAAASPPRKSFSKIVLASAFEFPYSTSSHGGVAQLGERLTGSQEVRGSIPLVSTRALNEAPTQVGAFFHIGTQGQRRHHDPPGRQDRKKLRRARPL